MGNPKFWRESVTDIELALPRYAPEHDYIVHDASLPFPKFAKELEYDGIILGSTFLDVRKHRSQYREIRDEYEFIGRSSAKTIALPQDDYNCAHILDDWMCDWNVSLVHSVISEYLEILYPKYLTGLGKMELGFTGYISNKLLLRAKNAPSRSGRKVDFFYRGTALSPLFGRLGYTKGEFPQKFSNFLNGSKYTSDISVGINSTLFGESWLDAIANSRFILGSNSGSSILDSRGQIQAAVARYLAANPDVRFEEVESACFAGCDEKYDFTAISPRAWEAALQDTCQLLVPGHYSGIMREWEHYIPVESDLSNIEEVMSAIEDKSAIKQIVRACREVFLNEPRLKIENHVMNLLGEIGQADEINPKKTQEFKKTIERHKKYVEKISPLVWAAHSVKSKIRRHLPFVRSLYWKFRNPYW